MGFLEALGHLKKPSFLPLWASSQSPARAAPQQYCPCQSVGTFNYSLPIQYMHCPKIVTIMYMRGPVLWRRSRTF